MKKNKIMKNVTIEEPHAKRRLHILKEHPEIKELFGHEPRSKYICAILVVSQVYLSVHFSNVESWLPYLTSIYIVGATITQALFLAIHEMSHNLFFKSTDHNKLFSIFANAPIVFPYAISFRQYHCDHHKHQGVRSVDTDLPTDLEIKYFQGKCGKLIWLATQIAWYAIRPVITRAQPFGYYHILNMIYQFMFNVAIISTFGFGPIIYMILSVVVAGGMHPCAGHFITEHYTLYDTNQETFSYYGPLNCLTWNVGYHNEHHDFPNVPWSRLHKLKCIARSHYDSLVVCPSWTHAMYKYVTDSRIGPHSRVTRSRSAKRVTFAS